MKTIGKALKVGVFSMGILFLFYGQAYAVPASCIPAQDCVDNAVPTTVQTCLTSNPLCIVPPPPVETDDGVFADQFAASAGVIAARAITLRKCDTRTFTHRQPCRACYRAAAFPLAHRYFGALFHGLLGNAVTLIRARMDTACNSLPIRDNRDRF